MNPGLAIALAVALLVGNAFFVAAEFAVISARRSSIEPLAAAGSARARAISAASPGSNIKALPLLIEPLTPGEVDARTTPELRML